MITARQLLLDRTRLLGCPHGLSVIWPPAYDLPNPHQAICQKDGWKLPKPLPLDKEPMAAKGRRAGFLQGLTLSPKWSALNMYIQETQIGLSVAYI